MNALAEPITMTSSEELDRLELLREYKRLFAGDGKTNRSPFADERVVRIDAQVQPWDVPEIHKRVRASMEESIRELHQGKFSKVVILAGETGMGKSHLLNHFRSSERQKELGYIFVGNNNFWKVEEFEPYLLTWLVASLTSPSIDGPNLLLEQIKDIAFEALDQILDQPGQIRRYQSGKALGWIGRIFWNMGKDKHALFKNSCEKRDESIFRRLNFHRFTAFVCDRFLADKSNPFHRFVVHVLLRYLFPEDRDKVCAWLIGQKVKDSFFDSLGGPYRTRDSEPRDPYWPNEAEVDAHFQKEFGISDSLSLNFKLVDTIKILVSLFSPDVVRGLKGNKPKSPGRIFLFAFDQIEGRDELFESEKDWFKFFAKLSELYNALPNIFVVFTMTTGLRNTLYPRMERQFQQRISRDQKYVLNRIDDAEVLALYCRHIDNWSADRLSDDARERLAAPRFAFHPFTQEEVLEIGRQKTLRTMLETFDERFRACMLESPPDDARRDYLIAINEFRAEEANAANAFTYSADHVEQVTRLMERAPGLISGGFHATLASVQPTKLVNGLSCLQLEFRSVAMPQRWVRTNIVRFGNAYNTKVQECLDLLHNKYKNRNYLWLVRPTKVLDQWAQDRPNQIFPRVLEDTAHSRLRALLHLLDMQDKLNEPSGMGELDKEKYRQDVQQILIEEIKLTYLGELIQHAAEALEQLGEEVADADK